MASIFVSRTDTEVDNRLDAIGSDEALGLRGRSALAVAHLCHEAYLDVLASERWQELAAAGANRQRPLWASTGTKSPDYPDTLYVAELVVADTVNTMPEATMQAFADHGEVRGDTVTGRGDEARAVLAAVEGLGIDVGDVFRVLEAEGVQKFIDPWTELIETMTGQLDAL